MRVKKRQCEVADCKQDATARGKCSRHYQAYWVRWRRACLKNGSLVETPAGVLPEPKWEFENEEGERELMEKVEREELRGART